MYDRDIQALQLCAANMDQNHFILQLLDKFGLVHWADSEFQISEVNDITLTFGNVSHLLIDC